MHQSELSKMEVTPILVSVPHACAYIGRGVAALYELIGDGKVEAKKSDGRTLIVYESLVKYANDLPRAVIAPPRRRKFQNLKPEMGSRDASPGGASENSRAPKHGARRRHNFTA